MTDLTFSLAIGYAIMFGHLLYAALTEPVRK